MALVQDILAFCMETPKILDQLDLWDEIRGWVSSLEMKAGGDNKTHAVNFVAEEVSGLDIAEEPGTLCLCQEHAFLQFRSEVVKRAIRFKSHAMQLRMFRHIMQIKDGTSMFLAEVNHRPKQDLKCLKPMWSRRMTWWWPCSGVEIRFQRWTWMAFVCSLCRFWALVSQVWAPYQSLSASLVWKTLFDFWIHTFWRAIGFLLLCQSSMKTLRRSPKLLLPFTRGSGWPGWPLLVTSPGCCWMPLGP